jgi:hypothetical protein
VDTRYIVECFWPDVRQEHVDAGAERIRSAARDGAVELAGSILVPDDEVVFYLFEGRPDAVREVCERAAIAYERIVRSVHTEDGRVGEWKRDAR